MKRVRSGTRGTAPAHRGDAAFRGPAPALRGGALVLSAWLCASAATAEQPAGDKAAKVVKVDNVDSARGHFERGQAAYAQGRLKEALSELQRAYALAPSAELAYDLGRVCERLGEADLAIAYFGTYLERSSDLADAERAALDKRLSALRALQKRQRSPLLAPPPSSAALDAEAHAFFARGIKLFAQGHYDGALAAFEAARRDDALPELAYDMALTAERLGRLQDAIDYYREYLRKAQAPTDADRVQAHIEALERRVLPD